MNPGIIEVMEESDGKDHVERVVLADGGTVDADIVVVGIGVVPNTQWLQGSGIELRDGVVCDQYCQSVSAPNIYAVGDCARWHNPLFDEVMRIAGWSRYDVDAIALIRGVFPVHYLRFPLARDLYYTALWGQVAQRMAMLHVLGGSKRTRLSTDRKSYVTGERVLVFARLQTPAAEPLQEPSVKGVFGLSSGGKQTEVILRATPDHPRGS